MFHKSSVKLAGLYLAVMMAISAFFSLTVYQLSTQEFDRVLRRPVPVQGQGFEGGMGPRYIARLEDNRLEELRIARSRVLMRLIIINLVILMGGGLLSYYLAQRTLRPIEKAHEALERFTADASHELRTPIAAMQNEIEVALMDPQLTLKDAKQQLQSNLEELAKLTMLSEGLLRLAQLSNDKIVFKKLSAKTIIEDAISHVLRRAEQKNILLETSKIKDAKFMGDKSSMAEAVVVLLDNAIKYSSSNSTVSVRVFEKAKTVNIAIKDKGMGIKATQLPHIFERFYRADAARAKQESGGYGIGLSIAKTITDLHGGSISVKSTPGKGSTFTVHLPKA